MPRNHEALLFWSGVCALSGGVISLVMAALLAALAGDGRRSQIVVYVGVGLVFLALAAVIGWARYVRTRRVRRRTVSPEPR